MTTWTRNRPAPTATQRREADRAASEAATHTRQIRESQADIATLAARRAERWLDANRAGQTLDELAAAGQVHRSTVVRALAWARDATGVESAQGARVAARSGYSPEDAKKGRALAVEGAHLSTTIRWHLAEVERLSAARDAALRRANLAGLTYAELCSRVVPAGCEPVTEAMVGRMIARAKALEVD